MVIERCAPVRTQPRENPDPVGFDRNLKPQMIGVAQLRHLVHGVRDDFLDPFLDRSGRGTRR